MFLTYLLIFLFGLIVGSFLNVVIFRMETGEQMVNGRSHCRHCSHVLEWYDLFPILSFLALGGKCRYCRKKLSMQYPLVEIATAILFLLIFNLQFSIYNSPCEIAPHELCSILQGEFSISNLQFSISLFYYLFIISALIVIFVYDLLHYIIPDKIVYSAIMVSIIYQLATVLKFIHLDLIGNWKLEIGNLITLFSPFTAALVAGAFFFAIVFLTRGEGMGGGDVKLAFLMGLILGWPKILVALFLAFTLGAICGIIFVIMKKKALKSAIPFGPFLVLGTLAAMFWGESIVKWYGGFLF